MVFGICGMYEIMVGPPHRPSRLSTAGWYPP